MAGRRRGRKPAATKDFDWIDESRSDWISTIKESDRYPNDVIDVLMIGCLQRIASSMEKISVNVDRIVENMDAQYDSDYMDLKNDNRRMKERLLELQRMLEEK